MAGGFLKAPRGVLRRLALYRTVAQERAITPLAELTNELHCGIQEGVKGKQPQ